MERRAVSSGNPMEQTVGYSRAVRVGDRICVSGTCAVWPDGSVDPITLSNFAYLQVVDPLKRVPGVSDVTLFGDTFVVSGSHPYANPGQYTVVTSVQHVADIMGKITAASQEQSAGIEEVNHAVTQMDEMTQRKEGVVKMVV